MKCGGRIGRTAQRLGRTDMVRFLQQFETGQGDYTPERRGWVDATTLGNLEELNAGEQPDQAKMD